MVDRKQTTRIRTIVTSVLLAAILSSCGKTSDWIQNRISTESGESEIAADPGIENYIAELGQIASGDPAAQAEIFADASAAAQLTPGPSTNLRLGLVLAIPGHPESDPQQAQSILREVLARDILLTPAEISLAVIHLNSVERQIVADAEARQLRSSSTLAARTQEQAISQRLSTVEAENRRLRRDLDEAEQKLEAITTIERSIREQE
jgi:hypothetical protein